MLNKKVIFVFHTIFRLDFIMQIIYDIIHNVCNLFSYFVCSLISVSRKPNIETMITFSYSYNWQKLNEKRSQEYQNMDPEYVIGQINSRILELLLRQFCCLIFAPSRMFDFCTVSKILICFNLMRRFPNDHKRYSSHLQVSILHRVPPIKVYLTIYKSLKNSYLKKFSFQR